MKERAIIYFMGVFTGLLFGLLVFSFISDKGLLIQEQEIKISEPNEASYKAFFGWE